MLEMNKKYYSIIQIYILLISMHIQNFIKIHKLIDKILSINKILTSIKGHNSVKKWPKIMCIRYNMALNAYTKFYQISSICSEDIEEKHIFTPIKGHNSVCFDFCLMALQHILGHFERGQLPLLHCSWQGYRNFEIQISPLDQWRHRRHRNVRPTIPNSHEN